MLKNQSKTEKFLATLIAGAFVAFAFSVFTQDPIGANPASAKSEDSGKSEKSAYSEESKKSEKSEGSEDSEYSEESKKSEKSEGSEDSEYSEDSEISEKSVASVESVQSVKKVAPIQTSTGANSKEVKSETSVVSEDLKQDTKELEISEKSEASTESLKQETSIGSEVGSVAKIDGTKAVITDKERFFFVVPVEVVTEVTYDEEGRVIARKKSVMNWIKDFLSF